MEMYLAFTSFTNILQRNVWELVVMPPESLPTCQNGVENLIIVKANSLEKFLGSSCRGFNRI